MMANSSIIVTNINRNGPKYVPDLFICLVSNPVKKNIATANINEKKQKKKESGLDDQDPKAVKDPKGCLQIHLY